MFLMGEVPLYRKRSRPWRPPISRRPRFQVVSPPPDLYQNIYSIYLFISLHGHIFYLSVHTNPPRNPAACSTNRQTRKGGVGARWRII